METTNIHKKIWIGKVISSKMAGVVVVEVERRKKHRLYPKTVKRNKKFHAAYNGAPLKAGTSVEFVEVRPLSKTVRFRIVDNKPKEPEIKPVKPVEKVNKIKTKVKKA